jgi:hypothetical protein
LIGFTVGTSYYITGYWICREVFNRLLQELLPSRLLETNAPLSTELTVAYQPSLKEASKPERYMVHIINWSSSRKTPAHPEMHDDQVALTDIRVKLNIPLRDVTIKTVISGNTPEHINADNGIEVMIPRILVNEIVCFEQSL